MGIEELTHTPLSEAERRAIEHDSAMALMPRRRA
jgi:hypothetical protein